MKHIAILDFGSQYTHLITKRIREFNCLAKIYPSDVDARKLKDAVGIILSGGPQSVFDKESPKPDEKIFKMGLPILGLCYGHQYLAHYFGGKVESGKHQEYGPADLLVKENSNILKNIKKKSKVWMSHGDAVTTLPNNFKIIGTTKNCPIAAMANEKENIFGIQFHPEVDHSEEGQTIIKNFVLNICQTKQNWKINNVVSEIKKTIKKQVGKKKVLVLVSGGVDSNVAFTLLTKTLGKKRVTGLYIDTGFMRQNESAKIVRNYKKIGLDNLEVIDASEYFYEKLKNVFDPEEKRNIIGKAFLHTKEIATKELKLDAREWMLGQGTIYPDIIESGGTKNADKIKTHHNRVDAIEEMIARGMVIEPLADFYKFEVRLIGKLLGLPKSLVDRHPFPGPGLAIRCLCWNQKSLDNNLKNKEKKVKQYCRKYYPNIKNKLLPIKSVGVQGDNRTYAHPLIVWGETNWKKLNSFSNGTTNSLSNVNRVLLHLNPSDKPRFKEVSENLFLTPERINILRQIDDIVMKFIRREKLYNKIWQVPTVLIPITDKSGKESIVLRPIITRDAMTLHFAKINKRLLKKLTKEILATGNVSNVFYDITNKPPGTIEWE
jgi:GMP synthase (glutamine-hydrolysing)